MRQRIVLSSVLFGVTGASRWLDDRVSNYFLPLTLWSALTTSLLFLVGFICFVVGVLVLIGPNIAPNVFTAITGKNEP